MPTQQKSALERAALAYGEVIFGKRGNALGRAVAIAAFFAVGIGGSIAAERLFGDASKPTHKVSAATSVPAQWDGNPNHADCSASGHPDPKHPGAIISDAGDDGDCVSNAPVKLTTIKPYTEAERAKSDHDWKRFNEVASSPRWISAPDKKSGEVDEFYELPGETGENACAEVIYSPPAYSTYTVSIPGPDGKGRDIKEPTRHLAEVAAVMVCGNGLRPR